MSTKTIIPCALLLAVLAGGLARGQEMASSPAAMQPPPGPAVTPADAVPGASPSLPGTLSSWITYVKPDCCGPIGGNGPIMAELFLRSGVAVPVEGAIFGHILETGWVIEGGGRSLFFNLQR